jgi:hypothetical protein
MRAEQIFALIASLAVLLWIAPGALKLTPAPREFTMRAAFVLVALWIVAALLFYVIS